MSALRGSRNGFRALLHDPGLPRRSPGGVWHHDVDLVDALLHVAVGVVEVSGGAAPDAFAEITTDITATSMRSG
jgi:hypothetical protein